MRTVLNTLAIGLKMSSMASVKSHGLMVPSTKVNTKEERSMGEASWSSLKEVIMMVNSEITRYAGMATTTGQMAKATKVNGQRTKCMGMEHSYGQTAVPMWGIS